mmetsp:Transcript_2975/g.5202  ORF Transcript_2975/g.5202 Transcript_2975/m.5202 type:complete len:201 (-) Transcript_2975:403-1005(-)
MVVLHIQNGYHNRKWSWNAPLGIYAFCVPKCAKNSVFDTNQVELLFAVFLTAVNFGHSFNAPIPKKGRVRADRRKFVFRAGVSNFAFNRCKVAPSPRSNGCHQHVRQINCDRLAKSDVWNNVDNEFWKPLIYGQRSLIILDHGEAVFSKSLNRSPEVRPGCKSAANFFNAHRMLPVFIANVKVEVFRQSNPMRTNPTSGD